MPWSALLDEDEPCDPQRSAAQVAGVLAMLGAPSRRVLDVGCGGGRVLLPLAAARHRVTGIDRSVRALARCRARLQESGAPAKLLEADFREPWPVPAASFDVVCCLGNTFMLLADPDDAVRFLARAAEALDAGGALLLDDCPQDLWPELTEGRWQRGVDEAGLMQMVWAPDDAVFTIRHGDQIDPECWQMRPEDRRLRLWSMGALGLAARLAGLSAPAHRPDAGLLVLRQAASGGSP